MCRVGRVKGSIGLVGVGLYTILCAAATALVCRTHLNKFNANFTAYVGCSWLVVYPAEGKALISLLNLLTFTVFIVLSAVYK